MLYTLEYRKFCEIIIVNHFTVFRLLTLFCLSGLTTSMPAQTLPEELTSAASLVDTSPTQTIFLPGENAGVLSKEVTQLHAKQARKGWELFTIESTYNKGKLSGFFLTYKLK